MDRQTDTHASRGDKAVFGRNLLWIIPLSFLAGMVNGLLGAGGGIILVFMLSYLLKGRPDGQKESFALSCTAVLSFSAVSAITYRLRGTFLLKDAAPYLAPALLGGVLGAMLLQRIQIEWLKNLFAVLLIYGGIRMMR